VAHRNARVFVGSSSEGRDVARNLQAELAGSCEVERWDQNVFEPSGYPLDSLLQMARNVDFAVLIATPDDVSISREVTSSAPRDNILLEFGLFAGVLGRERVYLLATARKLRLPTDVLGLTRLSYGSSAGGRAAVNDAALQIEERISTLGVVGEQAIVSDPNSLQRELDLLCSNAKAQGWSVKTNSLTTLRLISPHGKTHTLSKSHPDGTRSDLRSFVARLKADGLRVNRGLQRPVSESPF
jgi:hypothetical protein